MEKKKKSLQRDPSRFLVSAYLPDNIAAKVKTAIEGRVVKRKVRAIKNGKYRRNPNSTRDMTIADFMVESTTRRVKHIKPSREALEWKEEQLARNMAKRRAADAALR